MKVPVGALVHAARHLLPWVGGPGGRRCGDDSTSPSGSDQLVVGALLSLTGPGRTLGQTSEAALHLAADDLNAQLSGSGSPTRVRLRIEDTGLDPAQALDRLRTFAGEGVRILVGPSPAPRWPRSSHSPTARA